MKATVELPEGFTADYQNGILSVEANGETVEKKLDHALVDVEIDGDEIVISTEETRRNVKSIVSTFRSHAQNTVDGLENDHVYKMKGVYAHFPMTIKQEADKVLIENFMGERKPREIKIDDGVTVEIDGEDLKLRGSDKDAVSQTAGRIEQACKKGNRDPRTFQDGVYITSRGDEE